MIVNIFSLLEDILKGLLEILVKVINRGGICNG
jgi:hypothetical protein